MMSNNENVTLTAEQITALIVQRLAARVRNLRVRVASGGLILEGITSTYYTKQLAQHVAMQVSDLPVEANRITVLPTEQRSVPEGQEG